MSRTDTVAIEFVCDCGCNEFVVLDGNPSKFGCACCHEIYIGDSIDGSGED